MGFKDFLNAMSGAGDQLPADLPEYVVDEVHRVFPGAAIRTERTKDSRSWRREFDLEVEALGYTVAVEVEIDLESESVFELEIKYAKATHLRRIRYRSHIPLDKVPATVLDAARKEALKLVSSFEPVVCDVGIVDDEDTAYRVQGEVGDWTLQVKVMESGEVREVQKKRRFRLPPQEAFD